MHIRIVLSISNNFIPDVEKNQKITLFFLFEFFFKFKKSVKFTLKNGIDFLKNIKVHTAKKSGQTAKKKRLTDSPCDIVLIMIKASHKVGI